MQSPSIGLPCASHSVLHLSVESCVSHGAWCEQWLLFVVVCSACESHADAVRGVSGTGIWISAYPTIHDLRMLRSDECVYCDYCVYCSLFLSLNKRHAQSNTAVMVHPTATHVTSIIGTFIMLHGHARRASPPCDRDNKIPNQYGY